MPQFYELARKEIGALIVADEHPNIVRCFAMEEDTEFVYLALERCKQSLNDVLGSGTPQEGWSFVGPDGMPTALCMRVSNFHTERAPPVCSDTVWDPFVCQNHMLLPSDIQTLF